MAVALSERVLDNPTLNSVLFIDQEGQIQIRDQKQSGGGPFTIRRKLY